MNDILDLPDARPRKRDAAAVLADDFPVHPLAARFPLMADDELAELAEDIKANGQRHAIVLDRQGKTLVDGRNRVRACKLAEIEPWVERLHDQDPVAYIVSVNIERRHLTVGQRALLYAIAYPTPEKGGRGYKGSQPVREFGERYLGMARTVLREAPDLVDVVIAGGSLDQAYEKARQRRTDATSDEKQLIRLRAEAPDLVDLVEQGRLTASAAIAAHNQRQADIRQKTEAGRKAADQLLDFCAAVATIGTAAQLGERRLVTAEKLAQLEIAIGLLRQILANEQGERHAADQ